MVNKVISSLIFSLVFLFLLAPKVSEAHQPRIVSSNVTEITNPEVSQAFYGDLQGNDQIYNIKSDKEFNLYVGLTIPDIKGVNKQISAEIYQLKDNKKSIISILDGSKHEWTPFYEEFGQDNYLWGPEFKSPDSVKGVELKGNPVPAGDYYIRVYSPNHHGKYSLATGYLEEFPPKEIIKTLIVVPQLKINFFNYSLFELIRSPYIFVPILVAAVITIVAIYFINKSLSVKNTKKAKSS